LVAAVFDIVPKALILEIFNAYLPNDNDNADDNDADGNKAKWNDIPDICQRLLTLVMTDDPILLVPPAIVAVIVIVIFVVDAWVKDERIDIILNFLLSLYRFVLAVCLVLFSSTHYCTTHSC
jgi:hypothetical protein